VRGRIGGVPERAIEEDRALGDERIGAAQGSGEVGSEGVSEVYFELRPPHLLR
jgi:hypothetical protein